MKKFLPILLSLVVLSTGIFTSTPQSVNAATASYTQPKKQSNSYTMIRDALLANKRHGAFNPAEIKPSEVSLLIHKVRHENPEVLYYQSAKMWENGKLEFVYRLPEEVMKKNRAVLTREVDNVLKKIIKPGFTDFNKVKAIHDYLVLNTAYDYRNFNNNTIPADSFTAYGALINGIAVCDGYTKAAQIMLDRLGIENNYVVGKVNGTLHSWNQVKLDGHFYFMDITWDDPAPNNPTHVGYKYFLVTSEQLRKDHTWDEKKWPAATSKKYRYIHDFKSLNEVDNLYYYSNMSDEDKMYRISTDGKNKKRISNIRAPYLAVSGEWIYFSNYSSGGHLYKMKKNGSNLQKLNSVHSTDLSINGNRLHFINKKTKKPMQLAIK